MSTLTSRTDDYWSGTLAKTHPAPWRIGIDQKNVASVCVRDAHGNSVAAVQARRGVYHPTPETWTQARASAALIAAAPDLYNLLRWISDNPNAVGAGETRLAIARVLAKAEAQP
jgi:hypothetical protein